MKLDTEQIELRFLKHLITSTIAINKAIEKKITDKHFHFIPEQYNKCFTSAIFKLIHNYSLFLQTFLPFVIGRNIFLKCGKMY